MKPALHFLRAVLGWLTLAIVGTLALMAMLVTPGVERRRSIGRWTARMVLSAAGVRLVMTMTDERMAQTPLTHERSVEKALPLRCVVVANHTSYLDGLILNAVLPPRFVFVIKKEMSRVPLAGLLLRRIGAEFVDRFDRHRGAMDARRMLRLATEGQALAFFPEGTFSKTPGLLRFHSGAFVAAARAHCPVIPIVIHGARNVLPYNRIISTPGTVHVDILPPLTAKAEDSHSIARLRDEVRRLMLARLGEPDLSTGSHVAPVLPADVIKRA